MHGATTKKNSIHNLLHSRGQYKPKLVLALATCTHYLVQELAFGEQNSSGAPLRLGIRYHPCETQLSLVQHVLSLLHAFTQCGAEMSDERDIIRNTSFADSLFWKFITTVTLYHVRIRRYFHLFKASIRS